jgi:hypothetical protein
VSAQGVAHAGAPGHPRKRGKGRRVRLDGAYHLEAAPPGGGRRKLAGEGNLRVRRRHDVKTGKRGRDGDGEDVQDVEGITWRLEEPTVEAEEGRGGRNRRRSAADEGRGTAKTVTIPRLPSRFLRLGWSFRRDAALGGVGLTRGGRSWWIGGELSARSVGVSPSLVSLAEEEKGRARET